VYVLYINIHDAGELQQSVSVSATVAATVAAMIAAMIAACSKHRKLAVFRQRLKTFLFSRSYPDIVT